MSGLGQTLPLWEDEGCTLPGESPKTNFKKFLKLPQSRFMNSSQKADLQCDRKVITVVILLESVSLCTDAWWWQLHVFFGFFMTITHKLQLVDGLAINYA